MVACVFARVCARVIVCALALGVTGAVAQEAPSSEPAQQTKPAPETSEQKPATQSAPLPDMIVEASPKPPEKKKAKAVAKKPKSSTGGVAQPSVEPASSDPVILGQSLSDTGTTVFSGDSARVRSLGGGDANSFVRNLPNVQYQNYADENPGVDGQKELDTRPMQFSIMGGRTYENNIMLNGVSINNNTGAVDISTNMPTSELLQPILGNIYGLHSQTVYVPAEFVGQATVIESNASAKYGEFLGGAVLYELSEPPTDRYRASVTYSRQTDDMVHYIIGTKDGTNTNGVKHPTFEKNNLAISVGAPITSDWSFIAQASRKTVDTSKEKIYELYQKPINEDSDNIFFRFATAVRTDIGRFKLDSSLTKYSQLWESQHWRESEIDIESYGWTNQLEHRAKVDQIVAPGIGLGGVNILTRAYYNDSNTVNDANSNEAHLYRGMVRRRADVNSPWVVRFDTDDFDEWCRPLPESSLTGTQNVTTCRDGGNGDMEQGQTDIGLQHELNGKLLWGSFLLGGEARSIEGRRARPEDFTNYSSYTSTDSVTPVPGDGGGFHCLTGDTECTEEYYNAVKVVSRAFSTSATVNSLHLFSEIDQTLAWLNVRAGGRFDYDDYQKNPNVSPRLAATITPIEGLSFTGGYNRYYQGDALYYAVRDGVPFSETWSRSHASTTGNVPLIYNNTQKRTSYYTAKGLDTPYGDEYTGTARLVDPLTGGLFRLRYVERFGRDEYSPESCTGPTLGTCNVLTNEGWSFYESVTAEYRKYWSHLNTPFLSSLGVSANATWSNQKRRIGTYFYVSDENDDSNILYKEKPYTLQTFGQITGNLDIPIRLGATLNTSWFKDALFVDFNAGYNFGTEGVYDTDIDRTIGGITYNVWEDRTFSATFNLDMHAQYNVSDMVAIELEIDNLLDTAGNSVATATNPWVRGRSFWLGTKLRM